MQGRSHLQHPPNCRLENLALQRSQDLKAHGAQTQEETTARIIEITERLAARPAHRSLADDIQTDRQPGRPHGTFAAGFLEKLDGQEDSARRIQSQDASPPRWVCLGTSDGYSRHRPSSAGSRVRPAHYQARKTRYSQSRRDWRR